MLFGRAVQDDLEGFAVSVCEGVPGIDVEVVVVLLVGVDL